jgi:fucose permease
VMFILTPYIQIVLGNDAQATGIKLLPLIAGVIAGAGIGNVLASRLGARVGVTVGFLVTTAGLLIFSRISADTGYGLVGTALAVIGFGIGIALPTTLDIILGTLPPAQTGAGSALTRALQQIAASFGVAILGSILNNVYQADLNAHLTTLPAAARELALGSIAGAVAVASHLPAALGTPIAGAAKNAYTSGAATVTLVSAGLMFLTAIAIAIFLPSRITKMDDGESS